MTRPAKSTAGFDGGKYDNSNLTGFGLTTSTSSPCARNWTNGFKSSVVNGETKTICDSGGNKRVGICSRSENTWLSPVLAFASACKILSRCIFPYPGKVQPRYEAYNSNPTRFP